MDAVNMIIKGDLNALENYLKAGGTHEGEWSPILQAVESDNLDALYLLLSYNADVDAEGTENYSAYFESFPIHSVIANKNMDFLHVLLIHGANPNLLDDDGRCPLHTAVFWANVEAINLLLRYGADPLIKDHDNQTPLEEAIADLETECVEALSNNLSLEVNKNFNAIEVPTSGSTNIEKVIIEKGGSNKRKQELSTDKIEGKIQ